MRTPGQHISPVNNHFQSGGAPPPILPELEPKSGSGRHLLVILLNLFLALFLASGFVSLMDDSLVLLFGLHLLTVMSGILTFIAMLAAVLVYGLMGLTPMIPKRVFLPVTLFYVASLLVSLLILIYTFDRAPQGDWVLSLCQVLLVVGLVWWLQGGVKFRWPIVEDEHLGDRSFSWGNLSVFVLVNVFVLLPAVIVSVFFLAALAVDHYSEGFMALRPNGFSVQVRKYVRNDGKTIELFPMAHVADARFYQKVSQTFPTNSIILMEGVTDDRNLLTNKISYRRMAKSLGLSEQRQEFVPQRGEMVDADVDVDQFSKNTIDFLNLVMLVHAKGMTPANVQTLMQYSPPPHLQDEFINDLVHKRNQRVLEEIRLELPETDNLMVPWGVAHMPGIARAIQKSGFRLSETQEYMVIQFRKNRDR